MSVGLLWVPELELVCSRIQQRQGWFLSSSFLASGSTGPTALAGLLASIETGLRAEACEPAHLGQQGGYVPPRSLQLASPQVPTSSSIPNCYQRGLKDQVPRPGPWRCLQDGELTSALVFTGMLSLQRKSLVREQIPLTPHPPSLPCRTPIPPLAAGARALLAAC